MTLKDVKARLGAVGIPVAYHHFAKKTAPPFLLYEEEGGESISSDAHNHGGRSDIAVRLAAEKKDVVLEKKVEAVLDGVRYDKTCLWIESEKIYETTYDFTITNKEDDGK